VSVGSPTVLNLASGSVVCGSNYMVVNFCAWVWATTNTSDQGNDFEFLCKVTALQQSIP